jgi:hypothetical protein
MGLSPEARFVARYLRQYELAGAPKGETEAVVNVEDAHI